jgi:hypothetical protein
MANRCGGPVEAPGGARSSLWIARMPNGHWYSAGARGVLCWIAGLAHLAGFTLVHWKQEPG